MKKFSLFLAMALFVIHTGAQENSYSDMFSTAGQGEVKSNIQAPSDAGRSACSYVVDDGSSENSVGLIAGGDVMWLNYFTTTSGCEKIISAELTWGCPLFPGHIPNGGPCRVILYEDPTDDGDPNDAVYLTEAITTVVNAETDIFTTVGLTPTVVSGGFFIAALYQNQLAGQFPSSLDQPPSFPGTSWVAGNSTPGSFDVNDLLNNDITPLLLDNIGLAGNWLLRCEAQSTAPVPLADWAIYIGIILIAVFTVYRLRRMIA